MVQCWRCSGQKGSTFLNEHVIFWKSWERDLVFFCQSAFFHVELLRSPENPEFKKLSWKQTAGLTGGWRLDLGLLDFQICEKPISSLYRCPVFGAVLKLLKGDMFDGHRCCCPYFNGKTIKWLDQLYTANSNGPRREGIVCFQPGSDFPHGKAIIMVTTETVWWWSRPWTGHLAGGAACVLTMPLWCGSDKPHCRVRGWGPGLRVVSSKARSLLAGANAYALGSDSSGPSSPTAQLILFHPRMEWEVPVDFLFNLLWARVNAKKRSRSLAQVYRPSSRTNSSLPWHSFSFLHTCAVSKPRVPGRLTAPEPWARWREMLPSVINTRHNSVTAASTKEWRLNQYLEASKLN